jgi:hypothetical protein
MVTHGPAFTLSLLLPILFVACSPRNDADREASARDSIADSSASPQTPADGSPMQTSATVYQLRRHPAGVATEIVYTYTNSSGAPIYLVNCNGDVSPSLQREQAGKWEDAWSPIMNECLSPAVVIPAGGTYSDTLRMFVDSNHGDFYNDLVSSDGNRHYRLVWHQALSSFDSRGYPFGEKVPIEQRVSNPFVLKKP